MLISMFAITAQLPLPFSRGSPQLPAMMTLSSLAPMLTAHCEVPQNKEPVTASNVASTACIHAATLPRCDRLEHLAAHAVSLQLSPPQHLLEHWYPIQSMLLTCKPTSNTKQITALAGQLLVAEESLLAGQCVHQSQIRHGEARPV